MGVGMVVHACCTACHRFCPLGLWGSAFPLALLLLRYHAAWLVLLACYIIAGNSGWELVIVCYFAHLQHLSA